MKQRSLLLDFLKGLAIIAVILYHCGLLTYGYLGVEVFLVIGGYLITKSIMRGLDAGTFSYGRYMGKRLTRLCPLLIVVSGVSLAIAYFVMLPDNLKNVAETVVGTMTFTNNFVQYITSGNYWDQSNDFKPLMHTWYIALMMQFYVIFPLILYIDHRLQHRMNKNYIGGGIFILLIGILSLLCYVYPGASQAFTFYLLPARLFEFCIGGYIAVAAGGEKKNAFVLPFLLLLTVILFAVNSDFDGKRLRLLVMVACTAGLLVYHEKTTKPFGENIAIKGIARLGMMSYSLYLWHQVILAFYRYCITFDFSALDHIACIAMSLVAGWISYQLMEKRLGQWQGKTKMRNISVAAASVMLLLAFGYVSVKTYRAQGIVRDIPELDIYCNASPLFPQDYNASVGNRFDHDFEGAAGKQKILVVGDSYARDWTNVLIESGLVGGAEISYHTEVDSTLWQRSRQADIVYIANFGDYTKYSDMLPLWATKKFFRIGHKNFGKSMGPAYMSLRHDAAHIPTFSLPEDLVTMDEHESRVFEHHFISLTPKLEAGNLKNVVPTATPDRKLISHDGLHLTKAGAVYLAQQLQAEIKASLGQ